MMKELEILLEDVKTKPIKMKDVDGNIKEFWVCVQCEKPMTNFDDVKVLVSLHKASDHDSYNAFIFCKTCYEKLHSDRHLVII